MLAHTNSLSVRSTDSAVEVAIHERSLDDKNIQLVGDRLTEVADQAGAGTVRISFTEVAYLSSVALAKLVSLNRRLMKNGGKLLLVGLSEDLVQLFAITKLDRILSVHSREELAASA